MPSSKHESTMEETANKSSENGYESTYLRQEIFSLKQHDDQAPHNDHTQSLAEDYAEPEDWVRDKAGSIAAQRKSITLRDILKMRRQSMENLDRKEREKEQAEEQPEMTALDRMNTMTPRTNESDSEWTWETATEYRAKVKQHDLLHGEPPDDLKRRIKLKCRKCHMFMKTTKGQGPRKLMQSVWFYFAREYFTRIKILTNTIFVVAMLGMLCMYVDIWLLYDNDKDVYWAIYLCKSLVTFFTLILMVLIFFRYMLHHDFLRDSNTLSPNSSLWQCPKLLWMLFLELNICGFHIPPFADVEVTLFEKKYPLDTLGILMIVRLYLLKDVVRNFSGFFTTKMFTLGNIAQVKINSQYIFKVYMERRGFVMFIPFFVFVLFTMAFAVFLLENDFNSSFDSDFEDGYLEGLHLMTFTTLFVGFGDVYPTTELGRILVLIYLMFAFPVQIALLTFVNRYTKLTFREYQQVWALDYIDWLKLRTETAVNLIRRAWMTKTFAILQRSRDVYEEMKKSSFMSQVLPDKYDALLRGRSEINVYYDKSTFRELRSNHPEKPSLDPNNYLQQIIVLITNEDMQEQVINRLELGAEGALLKVEELLKKLRDRRLTQKKWQSQLDMAYTRIHFFYSLLVEYEETEGDGEVDLEGLFMVAHVLGMDCDDPSNFFKIWFADARQRYGEEGRVTANGLYLSIHKFIAQERKNLEIAVNRMRALISNGYRMNMDRLSALKDALFDREDDEGMITFSQFKEACVESTILLKEEDYRRVFYHASGSEETVNYDDLMKVCWEPKKVRTKRRTTSSGKPDVKDILADLKKKKEVQKEKILLGKVGDKKTDKDLPQISLETQDNTTLSKLLKERIRKRNEEAGIGMRANEDDDIPEGAKKLL